MIGLAQMLHQISVLYRPASRVAILLKFQSRTTSSLAFRAEQRPGIELSHLFDFSLMPDAWRSRAVSTVNFTPTRITQSGLDLWKYPSLSWQNWYCRYTVPQYTVSSRYGVQSWGDLENVLGRAPPYYFWERLKTGDATAPSKVIPVILPTVHLDGG